MLLLQGIISLEEHDLFVLALERDPERFVHQRKILRISAADYDLLLRFKG